MIHAGQEGLPNRSQAVAFAPSPSLHAISGAKPQNAALAIAELWTQRDRYQPVAFSRALTEIVGRPVLVVDLAAVPHAPTVRGTGNHTEVAFTKEQLGERARYLARQARETFPEQPQIWQHWRWRSVTAQVCAPNIDELLVKGGTPEAVQAAKQQPHRLVGACWDKAAVIMAPDRRWTPAQDWALISGIGGLMERNPPGNMVQAYSGVHESGHFMQRRIKFEKRGESWFQQRERWGLEYDADGLFLETARQQARLLQHQARTLQGAALTENRQARQELLENAAGVKHARALNGFLYATPRYWVALALDNPARYGLDRVTPPDPDDKKAMQRVHVNMVRAADKAFLAGYELRWRVAAQLEGKPLTEDSATLQAKIQDWRRHPGPAADPKSSQWELNYWFSDIFSRSKQAKTPDEPKRNFFWSEVNDVRQSIPALRHVLASGTITDPAAHRLGELVLQAAHYFRPSLTDSAPQRATLPQAGVTAALQPG